MKSIILFILLIMAVPTVLFADPEFSTAGLPAEGSGVSIVPLKKMNLPSTFLKTQDESLAQDKAKGYFNEESSYPKFLVKLGKFGSDDISASTDPYDTHMKYSPSQIKLAFDYKPYHTADPSQVIGFAAGGIFLTNAGWSGVAEFFKNNAIGTCKYNLDNIKITHGAVQMSAESVRYDVNKKPTDIFVRGSVNSGFIYSLSWFDETFIHTLECANMTYDKTIINQMIGLARNIDKG